MASIARIPNLNKGDPLHKKAKHAPKPDMRLRARGILASKETEPVINCLIYKRQDGSFYVTLQMRSHVKPDRLLNGGPVELAGESEREAGFKIGVLCGAMAERLDESYGDNFDVEKAARLGEEHFQTVMRAWERGKRA